MTTDEREEVDGWLLIPRNMRYAGRVEDRHFRDQVGPLGILEEFGGGGRGLSS